MKKLMYGVVIVAALGFGLSLDAKEVTFDVSAFSRENVEIIGATKTFEISKGTRIQRTFNLEKGTIDTQTEKKLLGLRKKVTSIEGYIKDIVVGKLKASDVKGLVEYINGIIDAVDQPTFILQKKGEGLSVVQSAVLGGKDVIFKFNKNYVENNLETESSYGVPASVGIKIKLEATTSDKSDKVLTYKYFEFKYMDYKLQLDMNGYRIVEFKEVKFGALQALYTRFEAPKIEINALNEKINKMVAGEMLDINVVIGVSVYDPQGSGNIRFDWPGR